MMPHQFAPVIAKNYQETHDTEGLKMSTLLIAHVTDVFETKAHAASI